MLTEGRRDGGVLLLHCRSDGLEHLQCKVLSKGHLGFRQNPSSAGTFQSATSNYWVLQEAASHPERRGHEEKVGAF